VRLAFDRREGRADAALGAAAVEPAAVGAEDDGGLGARLGGEALLEQVLGLLGLDARDGEVVLERPADGDAAGDDADHREQDGERREPWPAGDEGGDSGEERGHGEARYIDGI
jgi:hypothetical protein